MNGQDTNIKLFYRLKAKWCPEVLHMIRKKKPYKTY